MEFLLDVTTHGRTSRATLNILPTIAHPLVRLDSIAASFGGKGNFNLKSNLFRWGWRKRSHSILCHTLGWHSGIGYSGIWRSGRFLLYTWFGLFPEWLLDEIFDIEDFRSSLQMVSKMALKKRFWPLFFLVFLWLEQQWLLRAQFLPFPVKRPLHPPEVTLAWIGYLYLSIIVEHPLHDLV